MADGSLDSVVDAAAGLAPGGQADAFVETASREARGMHLARSSERPHVPLVRDERGVALRFVSHELSRCVHMSGDPDERLVLLATSLRDGSVPRLPVEAPPPDDSRALQALHPTLAALVGAARAALARDAAVESVDVEIQQSVRDVLVVSSRWGHAGRHRSWATASVTARVRSADGAGRASRSRGAFSIAEIDACALVDAAVQAAFSRVGACAAPAGRPAVIVAGGAAGVLLHEAVGHALEADVLARGSSFLAGRMGEPVATEALTVIDDPTLAGLAGSHGSDDEGAPGRSAPLIERGILRGVMTDALRAGFQDERVTGHGRRATFRDSVLPRMTNTLVMPGPWDPAELVATTHDGLLVTRLERASADPLRGRFQVRVTEGWRIEDGRLTSPVSETLLVGTSDDLLRHVAIGEDMSWDDGAGTCGREGQWVPVAVGNPTLRVPAGAFGVA